MTLASLVGPKGRILGLDRFGYSTPASVLDEKPGFTPASICRDFPSLPFGSA